MANENWQKLLPDRFTNCLTFTPGLSNCQVRGLRGLKNAQVATHILHGGGLELLPLEDIMNALENLPVVTFSASDFMQKDAPTIFNRAGFGSKTELRRQIKAGALYVNNQKISDDFKFTQEYLIGNAIAVLRTGSKRCKVIYITGWCDTIL